VSVRVRQGPMHASSGEPRPASVRSSTRRYAAREEPTVKRACDAVAATLLLVLFSPLMALLAVAIKLDSSGPVLFRSHRVGFRGEEFGMLKFRKMHRDAVGPPLTAREDKRLTRIGSFLRRTKLDELPQLWNVIRGDMSLVGPRPEVPEFVAHFRQEYQAVLRVKPGMTGLTQLAFARENHILERPELAGRYADRLLPAKIEIDTLYASRRSTWMDAKVLVWTVFVLLFGIDVAVDRGSGRLSVRRRPAVESAEVGWRSA
jgi:lipopolysaccharide/colanic/teichoic acid biosynthesis glycosyltransferase